MSDTRWSRDQVVTLVTLTVGYAGYYLCRSNLSLVTPLLTDRQWVGEIAAIGIVAYALGKVFTGWLGDLLGGRVMFLMGGLMSALLTVGCASLGRDHPPVLLWCLNLLAQSAGWAAAVRMLGEWFTPAQYARAISVLSLSYLFGDSLVRWALGGLVTPQASWQTVFNTSGIVLTVVTLGSWRILSDSTLQIAPRTDRTDGLQTDARSWIRRSGFWWAALAAFGLTLVREAFTFWTPALLHEMGGMPQHEAARWSGLFPLSGGASVLLLGGTGARLAPAARFRLLVTLLLAATAAIWWLSAGVRTGQASMLLVAIAAIAMALIGPYAILLGMFPLELGTVRRAASLAGILDMIGYTGAVFSGAWIGGVSARQGWPAALQALAVVVLASTVAAVGYGLSRRRVPR